MAGEYGTDLPYVDSNQSGIGNAVLGPIINPLEEQSKIDAGTTAAIDEYGKQQRKKIAENSTALAGLHPDIDGIMEEDTPYFQKKGQDILDLAQKAVATGKSINDPSNQYYWQLQSMVNNNLAEIGISKGQKRDYLKYMTAFLAKPDDFDSEATKANAIKFRLSGGPTARLQYSPDNILVSSTPGMTQIINDAFKGGPEKQPDESATTTKDAAGNVITTQTKGYDVGRVNAIMHNEYIGKNGQHIDKNYQKFTTQDERIGYQQQADIDAAASGEARSPADLWAQKQANLVVQKQQTSKFQFNPANSAYAREGAKNINGENEAKYLLETLREMHDNPDRAFGGPTQPVTMERMGNLKMQLGDLPGIEGGIVNAPRHAQLTLPLGNAVIPQYGKFANDDPKSPGMVNYDNVTGETSRPNQLLDVMEIDGKYYYQTTQTQQQALNPDMRAKYGVSKSGYKPLDLNKAPGMFAEGTNDPLAVKAAIPVVAKQMGLYNNGVFDFKKNQITNNKTQALKTYKVGSASFTDEQIQKGAAKYKMSVEDYKKSIGINE